MSRFRGKTALVTGAGKRIGRATALALADEGVNVVIHYNNSRSQAETVAEDIRRRGAGAWTVASDLSDPAAAVELLHAAVGMAGPVEVLVNSASIFPEGDLLSTELSQFYENLNVNALSPLLLSREFAAQKIQGSTIVNFLDTRILDYDSKHVPYHISKRVLFSMTRMLAMELAPTTRVNAIAPGLILPPSGEDETYLTRMAHTNPMNASGSLQDITRAVSFLLDSSFVTGQIIYVDGGRHMKGSFYGQ